MVIQIMKYIQSEDKTSKIEIEENFPNEYTKKYKRVKLYINVEENGKIV